MSSTASPTRTWIGWSFVAGCCTGIPAGIILTYLAVIPFYIGLFFFLLLGLLVGATMFRFGRNAVPVRPVTLRLIGTVIVLLTWTTTLVTEYVLFPGQAAAKVEVSWRPRPTPEKKLQISRQVRQSVMSQLLGRDYNGGVAAWLEGFPKYLRWVARDGAMRCPRVLDATTLQLPPVQCKGAWLFRVTLSLGLLTFSILSQYLLLARHQRSEDGGGDIPSIESSPTVPGGQTGGNST
jgi:hypothetical protein